MSKDIAKLSARLEKVWQPANFTIFFTHIDKPPHVIKKRTIIFNEGDPLGRIYFVKDGFIKLYRISEDGRDATSYLIGPGQVLGLRALLSEDESAKHNAEALTNTTVITLSRKEYLENLTQNPHNIVDLLHAFIERLNYSERKLEGFMFTDATARVANFLTDCARRFGKKTDGQIVLPLKLTHQLIADFVGSFRETVTNAIKKLEGEKIIQIEKGTVIILDKTKLNQYAKINK